MPGTVMGGRHAPAGMLCLMKMSWQGDGCDQQPYARTSLVIYVLGGAGSNLKQWVRMKSMRS